MTERVGREHVQKHREDQSEESTLQREKKKYMKVKQHMRKQQCDFF